MYGPPIEEKQVAGAQTLLLTLIFSDARFQIEKKTKKKKKRGHKEKHCATATFSQHDKSLLSLDWLIQFDKNEEKG
jgi:hypothetical protein